MSNAVPAPLGAVGHYTLLERLEPSGPGDLFRARDTRLGRTVTVRLLRGSLVADQAARANLLAQVSTVRQISHPNVIAVFDAGEHDGGVYLVFEYLKGQTLRAEMAGRPMNVRRAVELGIQIADAVAEAHACGFIHGALSPETVIITAKGHAKIPAFELAARAGFADIDGAGRLHDYDSPEEARGEAPDDRSDIHSVGAVLYEMLTTKRPSHKGAAAPSATNPQVPKELDEIVLTAIAPSPDSRYQSVVTFAAELRSLAAILDVRGVGTQDDEVGAESQSASIGRIVLLATVILLAVGLIVWFALAGSP
jgi:eukaryotic-like serine/threonine-protein kinase